MVLAMMEMVLPGVSTRKGTKITEELCGTSFSKSTVSRLCADLDTHVSAWKDRPLEAERYPFVLVDPIVVKVRRQEAIRPTSFLIALGINETGHKELLGMHVGDQESEESWSTLFRSRKQRGLKGVDIVASDAHGGRVKAVERHFQGVMWQRCQAHRTRNVLMATPKRAEMLGYLRRIFSSPSKKAACSRRPYRALKARRTKPSTFSRMAWTPRPRCWCCRTSTDGDYVRRTQWSGSIRGDTPS